MGGWRCSTCGVKERIEQVVDGYKPSLEAPVFGAVANASLDGDYEGVRGFGDNHSHRYEEVPDGAANLGTPVSQDGETAAPGLQESQGAAQDISPDLNKEERSE
jgi:hypothetical protein